MKKELRLQHFPISFFAPVLGFSGFSLALIKIRTIADFPEFIALLFVLFTTFLLVVVGGIYLTKFILYPEEVKKEFHHPIKMNFFPLISKIFLVFSLILLALNAESARLIWIIGTLLQSIFTIVILRIWILHTHFQIKHISPAWFIPVVGNVMIPIAGVHHAGPEINWLFFSVGIFWMFLLMNIVFYRVIFHDPIPEKLLPTFFITFAAPAIAFIAYTKLTGEIDPFGQILFFLSVFLLILNISMARSFLRIRFYLSWWAYSFPLAAFVLASLLYAEQTGNTFFQVFSLAIFLILAVLMILFSILTIQAIQKKKICIEE
jgi:tellurite resistance protein